MVINIRMKHIWHFDSGYSESETKLMSNCKCRFCPSAVTPEPWVGSAAQHFQGLVNDPLRSWCTAAKQFLKRKGKIWRCNKALKSSSETLNMDRISHSWQSWTCEAEFVPAPPGWWGPGEPQQLTQGMVWISLKASSSPLSVSGSGPQTAKHARREAWKVILQLSSWETWSRIEPSLYSLLSERKSAKTRSSSSMEPTERTSARENWVTPLASEPWTWNRDLASLQHVDGLQAEPQPWL